MVTSVAALSGIRAGLACGIGAVTGAMAGALRVVDRCGACRQRVGRGADTCSSCGVILVSPARAAQLSEQGAADPGEDEAGPGAATDEPEEIASARASSSRVSCSRG